MCSPCCPHCPHCLSPCLSPSAHSAAPPMPPLPSLSLVLTDTWHASSSAPQGLKSAALDVTMGSLPPLPVPEEEEEVVQPLLMPTRSPLPSLPLGSSPALLTSSKVDSSVIQEPAGEQQQSSCSVSSLQLSELPAWRTLSQQVSSCRVLSQQSWLCLRLDGCRLFSDYSSCFVLSLHFSELFSWWT